MIRLEHADRRSLLAVVRLQRRLVRVSQPEEVAAALQDAVTELGGEVVPAAAERSDALPFDLSCGTGAPVLPAAASGTRPRARLESVLPGLLEDARLVIARVTQESRQEELLLVDSLTGLPNRRAAERLLGRLSSGDSVAVLDLDLFKQVNDLHGHAAGDEVLAAFGRLLRERGRAQDHFGRLGGEEFVGIFPGTSAVEARDALDRLRLDWRAVAPYASTFSAGVAGVGPAGGQHALEAADEALYGAKRAGRDLVRLASPPDIPAPRKEAAAARAAAGASLPRLMQQLDHGEGRAATDLVLDLLDGGVPLDEVITDLLAPAQREVGRRWQSAAWSVAEEHVATSVIDGVLAAATLRAGRVPDPEAAQRPVLLVCPEGEWHQLPSRMFAALLAEEGLAVVQLGPSLPARDLQRVLAGRRYGAVVVSCTVLTSLPAARSTVRAAHEEGVPVLAGGQAFGPDSRRATALGADGWAGTATAAAELLRQWRTAPPTLASPSVAGVAEPLATGLGARERRRVVAGLRQRLPDVLSTDAAVAATFEDLGHILRHLDAAIAVDDSRLFVDFSQWLVSVLTARGLPALAVTAAYEEIENQAGDRWPSATRHLRLARQALSEPVSAG